MAKVNEGVGPIQPKTGDNAKALVRSTGYDATVSACESSTRSRYPASAMANHWSKEGVCGYGDNENIKGYGS